MRAIVFERFGGPEVLVERAIAPLVPGPGQVLVRVMAAAVNPVDIQTRRGDYRSATPLPGRLGVDVAGIVEQVGDAVEDLTVGDEVFYSPRLLANEGGYATHHVEDAAIVARKPANLSFAEAAALPLAGGTAWECLVERAALASGERVLIHGGAGGVGVYAVQLASALGAFTAATCRAEQAGFVRDLGADVTIDYRSPERHARLLEAGGGKGFDVILDTVGGTAIADSFELLAPFGRIATIVDHSTPLNLLRAWDRNATVHFVFTTQRRDRLDRLRTLVEQGAVKPVVERVLPLAAAAEAHRLVEAGGRRGKIVLDVSGRAADCRK